MISLTTPTQAAPEPQPSSPPVQAVDLRSSLTFQNSFSFPLQSAIARREVLIGGLWLLVPVVGWLLNMGHRIQMVHNMHQGKPAWPAWSNPRQLCWHGAVTFAGMVWYGWPGVSLFCAGLWTGRSGLLGLGFLLWLLAVIAIPGYMSHYCRSFDKREIFDPFRAFSRVLQGGTAYWKAWSIALTAMLLSFLGLLALGLGFLVTSVWFWQVAGFSFATVFTQHFKLDRTDAEPAD